MLGAIRQMGNNYYDALPDHIMFRIGEGALLSFSATALLSMKYDGMFDLTKPLLASAVAATASLIHALATPLFDKFLANSWLDEVLKMGSVQVITSALIQAVTSGGSTKFFFYSAISANLLKVLMHTPQANHENSAYLYLNIP